MIHRDTSATTEAHIIAIFPIPSDIYKSVRQSTLERRESIYDA